MLLRQEKEMMEWERNSHFQYSMFLLRKLWRIVPAPQSTCQWRFPNLTRVLEHSSSDELKNGVESLKERVKVVGSSATSVVYFFGKK